MHKIFLIVTLICLVSCQSKEDNQDKSIATLPSFELMLPDSSTILNTNQISKGNTMVFMYFRTDCEHCQQLTKNIIQNIDSLNNTTLYLLTPSSLSELKMFINTYQLGKYKNIIMAKDYEFSFNHTFRPQRVPFIAIYDSDKKLIKTYKEGATSHNIIAATNIIRHT